MSFGISPLTTEAGWSVCTTSPVSCYTEEPRFSGPWIHFLKMFSTVYKVTDTYFLAVHSGI